MASDANASVVNVSIQDHLSTSDVEDERSSDPNDPVVVEWGFNLQSLFRLALKFYREKDGKAMHLGYEDKLKLVALHRQALHGKYRADSSKAESVGLFDVIGSDRKQAWQALGDMSKEVASLEFVKLLSTLCPLFRPYVQAHRVEIEERARKRREEEEERQRLIAEEEQRRREEESRRNLETEVLRHQQHELMVRSALNQQTQQQFQQYAEAQLPGDREQQVALIRQLQEQHFQQYMQQVYQQQLLLQQQQLLVPQLAGAATEAAASHGCCTSAEQQHLGADHQCSSGHAHLNGTNGCGHGHSHGDSNTTGTSNGHAGAQSGAATLLEGSMWTRKDIKEFKEAIKKEAKLQKHADSIIKVGSGETVTIRVPTHDNGSCLFWEFATDSYDIAFGVYFEWNPSPQDSVHVHVDEPSEDEEDDDDETGAAAADSKSSGDTSKGGKGGKELPAAGPPIDEIIPIYRRNCQDEVYCGSHVYPGKGVYLLKFDNSYSLWRSKALYYRVYYS